MLTVKKLLRGKGKYWARKPSKELTSIEKLAWAAASELASLVELTIEAEDLSNTWPGTFTVLWRLEDYFHEIGHPISQSHAMVMLVAERVNRGLSPRGDDTKPPPKPRSSPVQVEASDG